MNDRGKPLYMIGVVADMLKVHPQTLRFYEKKGLVRPSRTEGQTRMYSAEDVEELRADFDTTQTGRALFAREGEGAIAINRAAREGAVLFAIVEEIRI